MKLSNYSMEGRQIFSDKGRLVATLNSEGIPVMAPGMAGAHSAGVQEFLNHFGENKPKAKDDIPETRAGEQVKLAAPAQQAQDSEPAKTDMSEAGTADWEISTIPESSLPPFDKAQGVYTPGFQDFINKHSLTELQVAALIKRLSR